MAKIKKKGQSGQAKNYITRTQAVRKLQISLPDFRRLCIFKGIYPREPRNFKKANKSATHSTTFYYTKDIQYLLHEPLLGKFREQKALAKKIARLLGKNEIQDAIRREKYGMPKIKLDHIIRERYPTFVDALRDLDDALSLLFLFANLPSTATVPPKIIARCQRLCQEFEHYLISTNSLRKSFLSIKGIYYQAVIQGQDIMWLVPYRFVQRVTQDVDYRIMGTFVEFYCTLLGFVNYRLYTSIGLVYPPKFNTASDERGAELAAFTMEGKKPVSLLNTPAHQFSIEGNEIEANNSGEVQAQIDVIEASGDQHTEAELLESAEETAMDSDAIDKFQVTAPEGDILLQPETSRAEAVTLFSNFTFFISREAPRHPIELLLRAFGCRRIGWDAILGDGAFTNDEKDTRITHQIVDRPANTATTPAAQDQNGSIDQNSQSIKPGYVMPGRTYIQPQWIWDCINDGQLVRTDFYAPGATLPPHLSPWMKPTNGQYDPRATLEEQAPEGEADEDVSESDSVSEVVSEDAEKVNKINEDDLSDLDKDADQVLARDDEGLEEENEFAGFDDDGSEEQHGADDVVDDETRHRREFEAEMSGRAIRLGDDPPERVAKEKAKKERTSQKSQQNEDIERRKMMMTKKKRKLFESMQLSNKRKDAEAEKLRHKRRKMERADR